MEKQKEEADEDGKGKSLYKADEYSNRNKYGTQTANISLFFYFQVPNNVDVILCFKNFLKIDFCPYLP